MYSSWLEIVIDYLFIFNGKYSEKIVNNLQKRDKMEIFIDQIQNFLDLHSLG